MKHFFLILFVVMVSMICSLSSCQSDKPFFYNYYGELDLGKPLLIDAEPYMICPIFDVNNASYKGYTIYKDSCEFNITVDENGLINGLYTSSKQFNVNGFQVGDTITIFTGKKGRLRGFSDFVCGEIGNGWRILYDKKYKVIRIILKN